MKPFLLFLKEELNDKQKKTVDAWAANAPHHSFSDHVFGEKGHTVNIPLQSEKPDHQKKVEGHLLTNGFKVHDYNAGIAKDKHGRDVKIGRALVKTKAPKDLLDQFANREKSGGDGTDKHYIKISRHPHDVGAMSTGQSWSSCMNLDGGINKRYVKNAIHEGTHVAYLMHKDHKNPISRINLTPFQNKKGHKILRPEGSTYGSEDHSDKFRNSVRAWSEEHFPAKEKTLYTKSKKVYDDDFNHYVIANDKETASHFLSNPEAIKGEAQRNPEHHMAFFQEQAENKSRLYGNAKSHILSTNHDVAKYVYDKGINDTRKEKEIYEDYVGHILKHHSDIAQHHFTNNMLPAIQKLKEKSSKSGILNLERIRHDNNSTNELYNALSHKNTVHSVLNAPEVSESHMNFIADRYHDPEIIKKAMTHPSMHKTLSIGTLKYHFGQTYRGEFDGEHGMYYKTEITRDPKNPVRSKSVRKAVLSHPELLTKDNKKLHTKLTKLFDSVEQDQD